MFDLFNKVEHKNVLEQSNPDWLKELCLSLKEKVCCDIVTLQLYSTAACFYDITPMAVVIPDNIEDIITTVKICAKYNVPVLPRGAGSSLSGNSVGKAVLMDLTHGFKEITFINDRKVKSGVGVVLNHLQDRLKRTNRLFAPDPSSGNVCVIGGMLGNNSGGPHTLKHGNMYKHVEEITAVLSNGKIFNAKNISLVDIHKLDDFHKPYYEKVKQLLEKYSDDITTSRPNVTKSTSGYQVWDILTDTHLNMASLMVGSEGTLGVFTDATLKVIPAIKHRGILSLYFTDIAKMGTAVKHLRALGASAIEFVDQSFIQLALSFRPELKKFLPEYVKYLLYVEYEDDEIKNIEDLFTKTRQIIFDHEKLAEVGACSVDEEEIANIFRIRKAATVILNKIQGKEKPVPFIEDAAIHPDRFSEFLIDQAKLLENFSCKYVVFGHAGDGNLHIRPLSNFRDENTFNETDRLTQSYVDLVLKYKGTLSGEHGDGRLRTPFLKKCYPKLIPLFEEIKNLFDPSRIMNPDIIVPLKEYKWNENLRYSPDYKYIQTSSRLDADKWRMEIEKCHGCGTCREYCPVFIATGEEEATARAKANILRGMISGKVSADAVDTSHFYKIMDYCINCGQCITDCPTAVNIPGMAILAKEKLRENRSYKISEYILQRGNQVSTLASLFSSVSNIAMSTPLMRTLMHFTIGIDRRRNMPRFFRQKKQPQLLDGKIGKKVVLWSGCAAQFNDPQGELKSCKQILNKLGYDVILPDWKCCSVAKLSYGNIKDSLNDIEYNIKVLLPYVNQNIPILFTSASCGYAFMHEYETLFNDNADIKKIAQSSKDIHDFLGSVFLNGEQKYSFTPISKKVVYHAPCHLKVQKNKFGPTDLLKVIPNLELCRINDSCCGIAGTFGMKKENFDLSMEIGSALFAEIKTASPDYVLSGCGTCQIQIRQGTGLDVIHPIILLNESFQQMGGKE
ncbi:MAG: anaerobic glycerol-3-phosphate dehydrogenase subunit C [bacterium]